MSSFDFFKTVDINAELLRIRALPDALLLDVRSPEEYSGGHIPGSVNLPLPEIDQAESRFPDKSRPVFIYCLSGARSGQALAVMKRQGYTDLTNIGGIRAYSGKLEMGR